MASKIKLENFKRDQVTFTLKSGKVVLGSIDDKTNVDPSVPKPWVEVSSDQFGELKKLKAFQGLVDTGAIRIFS